MLYVKGLWESFEAKTSSAVIHLILPPIGLLGSTDIGTLGQLLWVPVSVSFFNVSIISKYITKKSQDALNLLSVLNFVLISRTLLLGHLQNFRVLLGDSAFGSAKSQETPYFEVWILSVIFLKLFSKWLPQTWFWSSTNSLILSFSCHDFCSLSNSRK